MGSNPIISAIFKLRFVGVFLCLEIGFSVRGESGCFVPIGFLCRIRMPSWRRRGDRRTRDGIMPPDLGVPKVLGSLPRLGCQVVAHPDL